MPPETVASLAQKIAASPKHYILLLGSGISKDAGIKSGWEVTNILIRQVLSSHDAIGDVNSLKKQSYGTNILRYLVSYPHLADYLIN